MTYHSPTTVAKLVADIESRGFGVIPDFVAASDLARMRAFVAKAVKNTNGEYAGFTGPEAVAGSGLDELARSPGFRAIVREVYERGTGRKAPEQDFYQVLRCLTGATGRRHSYLFHYDSYVVTVLIPIEIPTTGQPGDLLMLPNTRRIRRTYARNVVDKIILDNPLSQFLLRRLTIANIIRPTRIKMVPGNAYFFWGYRSVHTNEPCDADRVRATALFHFANPHARKGAA
jgi:hypothetical protein